MRINDLLYSVPCTENQRILSEGSEGPGAEKSGTSSPVTSRVWRAGIRPGNVRGKLRKNRLEKPRGGSPREDAVFRPQSPPSSPSRAGGTQLGGEEGRMKEWGVTRASRRQGNGCPASHVRCHTRCGHELLTAPTCCARARRRSEGPTSRRATSVARPRSAHSSRASPAQCRPI